jgi:hypothetical protein
MPPHSAQRAAGGLAVVPPGLPHALEGAGTVSSEASTDETLTPDGELPEFLAGPRGEDDLVVACGRVRAVYAGGLGLFDRLREPRGEASRIRKSKPLLARLPRVVRAVAGAVPHGLSLTKVERDVRGRPWPPGFGACPA